MEDKILFVMGNGPSLGDVMNNPIKLNFIKKHHTFGLNAAYRAYEKYNFYPTYFGCFDYVVNESHKDAFEKLVLENNSIKEFYFIGNSNQKQNLFREEVRNNKRFKKFNFIPTDPLKCDRLSTSYKEFINFGCSGANAVQVGLMKGYRKIILLGCDCNYVNKIKEERSLNVGKQIEIVEEIKNNCNYWFDNYQVVGDRLNTPDAKIWHIPAWNNVKKYCPENTKIINCSEISEIKFFEKQKFSELFINPDLKYTFNKKTVFCDTFNLNYEKLDNRIIQYKNILYYCSYEDNILVLHNYSYFKWNELIKKLKNTIDILKIDDINCNYIYGNEAKIIPKKKLKNGISFVIRAKNEKQNIYFALISLRNIVNQEKFNSEIIFVDNNSNDGTYNEVVRICNLENIKNVYLYKYNVDVFRSGEEHAKYYNNDYSRTLAKYYNWCVEKANKFYFIKWDCDFYAITDNIIDMINKYNLHTSDEDQSIWFSGKTLFENDKNYYINTDTRYNEFRLFSKKHGANYVNVPRWEIISKDYLKNTKRKVFTKCLFLEFKRCTQIKLRDNFRDSHDNYIINNIKQNKFTYYKNRYSFHEDIVKLDYKPLSQCYYSNKNKVFNNLVASYMELTELQKYWILNYIRDNPIKFNYPDNIIISGLWVGNHLDIIHKMCVESFIRTNHLYILYTYEPIDNLPDNVVIMDGNEIIPEKLIYKYDDSYAGFSDLFRNCLLYYKGGWYVDLDIYNLKTYDCSAKNVYSYDYYPTYNDFSNTTLEIKKKNNEIIENKYYVPTNPVKCEKKDRMFFSQFKFILDKILFMKIKNIINIEQKYNFNNFLKENNLTDIYEYYYKPIKSYNLNFYELLKLNNININNLSQNSWGEIGPLLCTKNVIKYNRYNLCLKPEILQGIIKYNEVEKYIEKNFDYSKLKNSYSLDLFYTMWKRKDIIKYVNDKNYISNTLLDALINHKINNLIK